jgi:hypothetical protein
MTKIAFILILIVQQLSNVIGIFVLTIIANSDLNIFLKLSSILVLFILDGLTFINDKILITYSF